VDSVTRQNHHALLVGITAIGFSVLYFISDVIELFQNGFSTLHLGLTYAAEAAVPLFVLWLYAVQRPQNGRLGFVGAVTYAYTFSFFTGTVVYALVNRTTDWQMLQRQLGVWLTIHSALMVVAGTTFGLAVARAKVLPRWTSITLIAGMVLFAATSGLPETMRTITAVVRDLVFAAMGASILQGANFAGRPIDSALAQPAPPRGPHAYDGTFGTVEPCGNPVR
jgi:Ca2+/Na+ antiporter